MDELRWWYKLTVQGVFYAVLYTLTVLLTMLLVTAAIVIVHRIVSDKRARANQQMETRLLNSLYEVLDEQRRWRYRKGKERRILKPLMVRVAGQVKGEMRTSLQSHYASQGFLLEDTRALHSRSVISRLKAMDNLEVMADSTVVEALRARLDEKSPIIRIRAARLLYQLGFNNLEELIGALDPDQHFMTRFFAEILVEMGDSVIPYLVQYVNNHPHAQNAGLIVRIVGEAKTGEMVEHLKGWLNSPADEVRINAVRMLSQSGRSEVASCIAASLSDSHAVVRMMAVRGLGELGAREYAKKLLDALQDEDSRVCIETAATLMKFGVQARQVAEPLQKWFDYVLQMRREWSIS